MSNSRTHLDTVAARGAGFPLILPLMILGTFTATQTKVDGALLPKSLNAAQGGGNTGAGFSLSHASIWCSTPGDRTTGSYTILLVKTDGAGNSLGTVATLSVPFGGGPTLIDLRDSNHIGIRLKPGEGIRLDTGAAATGGTTSAANIRVTLFAEAYGIAA